MIGRSLGLALDAERRACAKASKMGKACVACGIERMPVWLEMRLTRVDSAEKAFI